MLENPSLRPPVPRRVLKNASSPKQCQNDVSVKSSEVTNVWDEGEFECEFECDFPHPQPPYHTQCGLIGKLRNRM